MQRGYIKIWRKLEDSGLLQMHGTLALFMYILMKATHKPTKIGTPIGVIELDRGQYISGRHKLSSAVGLSDREIRTCLARLTELDILTVKTTNRFSIYTIVNYSNYQDCDQQSDQQTTNKRPADDQQTTTKQTLKHLSIKEENNNTRKSSLSKLIDLGVDEQIAKDWLLIRKTKKLPFTETALKQISKEADLANLTFPQVIEICAINNWGGYKSSWPIPEGSQPKKPFDMDTFLKAKNG
jgi:hypothetical protein